MASVAFKDEIAPASASATRVYSICLFDPGFVVPRVTLLEAQSDEAAINAAHEMNHGSGHELWDQDRLVVAVPAKS